VFFRGRPARPDLFVDMDQRKLPQNKGEEENFQISVCVRAFLHYLLSRIQKIDDAEFTINQWQSERIVISR
jgi:hypothetical protein